MSGEPVRPPYPGLGIHSCKGGCNEKSHSHCDADHFDLLVQSGILNEASTRVELRGFTRVSSDYNFFPICFQTKNIQSFLAGPEETLSLSVSFLASFRVSRMFSNPTLRYIAIDQIVSTVATASIAKAP